MIKTKLLILTAFLSGTMLGSSAAVTTSNSFQRRKLNQDKVSFVQDPVYESRLGWNLAGGLTNGCSIFIGTVQEVTRPEHPEKTTDPPISSHLRVTVTIDEWLYGKPQQWERQVQIDQVPIELSLGYEPRGDVWKSVKLEVGKRLLIVFSPATASSIESQEIPNKIDRYRLVVSNEKLFPAIRATVANHARYVNKPEDMLDAPTMLNVQADNIFIGYLASHLYYNGGNENTDTDAILISQLIGNSRVPESYWRLLVGPLVRAMTNDDYPVRETTRTQVTENLVAAGCSRNAALATSALRALVMLSDDGRIDVKPFLTGNRRQKLIRNYKALITPGSVDKGQVSFEAQLGIR